MKKYQVICMSFDGEYKRETPLFETIEDAWDYTDRLGSKWYFYPFCFVVSGETIRSAGFLLGRFEGMRINTVKREFLAASKAPENENADAEQFALYLHLQ